MRESPQSFRRKSLDCANKTGITWRITPEKTWKSLGMRQIKPAAACHQEFAPRARHPFENSHTMAGTRQPLRRDKSRGAGADDHPCFLPYFYCVQNHALFAISDLYDGREVRYRIQSLIHCEYE